MSRFGGFFSSSRVATTSSRHDAWSGDNEAQALQEAMRGAARIMNDEVEEAEADLKNGSSPFHKLGRATAIYFRAVLGFEKDVMEQATAALLEAEEASSESHRRAQKDPAYAHCSNIYPPGAEYALCHAESQLMLAVVGILNESLMETLRSFQRLRKAFATLHELVEVEKKYLASIGSVLSTPSSSSTPGTQTPDEEELPFEDAAQDLVDPQMPDEYQGHIASLDIGKLKIQARPAVMNGPDMRMATSHPIDLFIHSGISLCHGLLQLLLSMVPPTFSKVLSFFSFQGDRESGLRELWTATGYKQNINGAMAGMVILTFHNTAINLGDILLPATYPKQQLQSLLDELSVLYPKSKLWPLEQSRMHGFARDIPLANHTLITSPPSTLKQLEALRLFEQSLNTLFLHDYETTASLFLSCVGKNDWSHALYYFIAGICHVELHRDALNTSSSLNPSTSTDHAEKAISYLYKSHASLGRKKFMSKPLPFDAFVSRKLAKWNILTSPSSTSPTTLLSNIGPSPAVEMIYFWSGFKKQAPKLLAKSLERLTLFPPPSSPSPSPPSVKKWEADDVAIWHTLHGTLLRFQSTGPDAALPILRQKVLNSQTLAELKACAGGKGDTWPLAVARYEVAVCLFQQAQALDDAGDDDAGEVDGRQGEKQQEKRMGLLEECRRELEIVSKFGDGGGSGFELSTRIGLKITQGKETLKACGVRM